MNLNPYYSPKTFEEFCTRVIGSISRQISPAELLNQPLFDKIAAMLRKEFSAVGPQITGWVTEVLEAHRAQAAKLAAPTPPTL